MVGYSSRCKVCNSPYRVAIEQWSREGFSSRQIAERLEQEYDERISYRAIHRHMQEHFDVQETAREQYERSQQLMRQETAKVLSDVERLEQAINRNYELFLMVHGWLAELVRIRADKLPHALVQLYKAANEEIRQHIKQKQELLGLDAGEHGKKVDFVELLNAAWDLIEQEENTSNPVG